MPTHMGIAITQLIHLTVRITQLIHLTVRINTKLQCTHSHISYLLFFLHEHFHTGLPIRNQLQKIRLQVHSSWNSSIIGYLNAKGAKARWKHQEHRCRPPPPPNFDLIVSRKECCPFRSPGNSIRVPSNPSNADYHLRMECLKATDPGFNPLSMVLPHDVKVKLSVEHKQLLSSNFGFLVFWFTSVHHGAGMVWVAWRLLWSYALCGFACRLLWSYALCGFACRLLWSYALRGFACRLLWSYVVLPVGYCEVMWFCL